MSARNTSVEVVEILQSTNEHEPHAWVEITMGGNTLTVRVDGEVPITRPGERAVIGNAFHVYLSAGDASDPENRDLGRELEIPYV